MQHFGHVYLFRFIFKPFLGQIVCVFPTDLLFIYVFTLCVTKNHQHVAMQYDSECVENDSSILKRPI